MACPTQGMFLRDRHNAKLRQTETGSRKSACFGRNFAILEVSVIILRNHPRLWRVSVEVVCQARPYRAHCAQTCVIKTP